MCNCIVWSDPVNRSWSLGLPLVNRSAAQDPTSTELRLLLVSRLDTPQRWSTGRWSTGRCPVPLALFVLESLYAATSPFQPPTLLGSHSHSHPPFAGSHPDQHGGLRHTILHITSFTTPCASLSPYRQASATRPCTCMLVHPYPRTSPYTPSPHTYGYGLHRIIAHERCSSIIRVLRSRVSSRVSPPEAGSTQTRLHVFVHLEAQRRLAWVALPPRQAKARGRGGLQANAVPAPPRRRRSRVERYVR